jgi:hypothetical protein
LGTEGNKIKVECLHITERDDKDENGRRNQRTVRELRKERLTQGPYIEKDNIALHATKQALEWVLEETETLLTY